MNHSAIAQRLDPRPRHGAFWNSFSCVSCLSWFLLFFLCWFLFFHRLADRDLWNSHEARAAQDAQTILDDGCWGLPRLYDGRLELQKPPLYYWLAALVARCRGGGVDAWAVRLPAALAGFGCVLALNWLGRRLDRPRAGLIAALVLATAMHFTWLARVGRIDMPLTLTVTLSLAGFCMVRAASCLAATRSGALRCASRLNGKVIIYLAIAAGLLLKGPIALVLPAAVIGVHLLVERELPPPWHLRRWGSLVHRLGLWWGVPLVLLVAGSWYLWAQVQTDGEFVRVFFWHHNVERGLGGSERLRAHPWWYYGPQFLFDFLPWSPALLFAGGWLWVRGGWREDALARFGLVWLLTVVVVLSCFRFKRADYLLPAYPGAALFLGCIADRCYRQVRYPRRLAVSLGAVVAACVVGWLIHVEWILPRQEPAREYRRFAEEIRRHAPAPERVLFFRTESHALAFHVGRPLEVQVWWHDLDEWASRPGIRYVVMPLAVAQERMKFLKSCCLEEVVSNSDLAGGAHEKPLVLLRTRPGTAE